MDDPTSPYRRKCTRMRSDERRSRFLYSLNVFTAMKRQSGNRSFASEPAQHRVFRERPCRTEPLFTVDLNVKFGIGINCKHLPGRGTVYKFGRKGTHQGIQIREWSNTKARAKDSNPELCISSAAQTLCRAIRERCCTNARRIKDTVDHKSNDPC